MRTVLHAALLILPLATCKVFDDPENEELRVRLREWRKEQGSVNAVLGQPGPWGEATVAVLRTSSERLRSKAESFSDYHWSRERATRCRETGACMKRQARLTEALATAIQQDNGEAVRDLTPRLRMAEDETHASFEGLLGPCSIR